MVSELVPAPAAWIAREKEGQGPTERKAEALKLQLAMMAHVRQQEWLQAAEMIDRVLLLDPYNALCVEMRTVLHEKIELDNETSDEGEEGDGTENDEQGKTFEVFPFLRNFTSTSCFRLRSS